MNLREKTILVFGGDSFLWEMIDIRLKVSEANVTWVNSSDYFKRLNLTGKKIVFESIQSVGTYENFFEEVNSGLVPYDGIIFSLSEGSLRPLTLTKSSHVASMFEINCMSFVELIRILNRNKKIKEGASIVAISSISSLLGLKTKLAYAISKAALNSAVLNLASELTAKKIRVNSILKGALTTDLNQEHIKNMISVGIGKATTQELGMSSPEEVASLCIFLLSDEVKTMTGALIKLDGGYSLGE